MKFQRLSNINTKRDAWVEINLDAIEHNILELKSFVPNNVKILVFLVFFKTYHSFSYFFEYPKQRNFIMICWKSKDIFPINSYGYLY